VVLGLPRGGVPVAFEVARALGAPLDIFVVRKLGVPGHWELAMGALASGGVRVLNPEVVQAAGLTEQDVEEATRREQEALEQQEAELRGGEPPQPLEGRAAVLIDDGLATGASMRAAVAAVRAREVASTTVAVPVAPAETCARLRGEVDEVICLLTPEPFTAVGAWYVDFAAVPGQEVRRLLGESARGGGPS